MKRALQLFGIVCVALVLTAGPASAQRNRGDRDLEQQRQRWSQKSRQEREVLMRRYQELQRLSPDERQKLMERAQRFEKMQKSLRDTAPEDLRKEIDSLEPSGRERRWREHTVKRSREMGRELRESMSPELRRRLETASPEERQRMLEQFGRKQEEMSSRAIREMGRVLGLPREEIRKMEALPVEQRLQVMMGLKRKLMTKRIEASGLPQGLDEATWQRMQKLSDEEFLQRMRTIVPMRGRGDRRRDWRQRGQRRSDRTEDFSRNRRRDGRFQERDR